MDKPGAALARPLSIRSVLGRAFSIFKKRPGRWGGLLAISGLGLVGASAFLSYGEFWGLRIWTDYEALGAAFLTISLFIAPQGAVAALSLKAMAAPSCQLARPRTGARLAGAALCVAWPAALITLALLPWLNLSDLFPSLAMTLPPFFYTPLALLVLTGAVAVALSVAAAFSTAAIFSMRTSPRRGLLLALSLIAIAVSLISLIMMIPGKSFAYELSWLVFSLMAANVAAFAVAAVMHSGPLTALKEIRRLTRGRRLRVISLFALAPFFALSVQPLIIALSAQPVIDAGYIANIPSFVFSAGRAVSVIIAIIVYIIEGWALAVFPGLLAAAIYADLRALGAEERP